MKKEQIISIIAILALAISAIAFFKPRTVEIKTIRDVATEATGNLSAVPTLDGVDNPYIKIGGSEYYYYSAPISATSSVFCSLLNPYAPATSTILNATTRITGTIGAASTFDIATGTSQYQGSATSSPALVRARSVGAGAQDTNVWTPRNASTSVPTNSGTLFWADYTSESPYFIYGTQRLNWQIATATPGTDYYEGRCSALLKKI